MLRLSRSLYDIIKEVHMGLTIVALVLFLAMVAAWVVLPGSMMALPIEDSADPMPATAAGQTA
jgi:hypothetical protein